MKKLGVVLLVVIALFGGIVAVTQSVTHSREKARQERELSELKEAYLALAMYRSDRGQFPAQLTDLIPGYLPEESRQKIATYQYSPLTPDRLLVRGEATVRADGSGSVQRTQ